MKKIAVLTSGGDSPGMNTAIRAVVRAAHYHNVEVLGVLRGFQGLIEGNVRRLGPRDVGGIISRGGTILRSARCKEFHEADSRARAVETIRANGIEGLVVIGGDGSYRGAAALHDEHGVPCIGVPGTIDNDIGGTDYTIGYDTALNTALDAIDRLRDTALSHDRIFFVEVMGHKSGYLAMMSGIAGGAEDILVPEYPTDIDKLVAHLHECHEKEKTSSIVVVAEGDDAGTAFDIAKQVEERSEFKNTRVTVIGHLQRGGSPTAFDRILATRLGIRAVEALLAGEQAKMAGVQGMDVVLEPLATAWESRTTFDPEYQSIVDILST